MRSARQRYESGAISSLSLDGQLFDTIAVAEEEAHALRWMQNVALDLFWLVDSSDEVTAWADFVAHKVDIRFDKFKISKKNRTRISRDSPSPFLTSQQPSCASHFCN